MTGERFADCFQIHVLDERSEGDFGGVWTRQTVLDGLAVLDDALAIGTAVNDTVAVGVYVLAHRPDNDSDEFDHVVEASLHTPLGQLLVMGCTDCLDDAARFDAPAGWSRVRASRRNIAAAVRWSESDEEPENHRGGPAPDLAGPVLRAAHRQALDPGTELTHCGALRRAHRATAHPTASALPRRPRRDCRRAPRTPPEARPYAPLPLLGSRHTVEPDSLGPARWAAR
ncbi:hypothetical protein [Streptomyces clavuligerus]|uniref:hypothetical protein n=5 Tax=Streptomyces clavuligerus TaxID=1901 RepID=UPI000318A838|nr:hypothetical protein [Streptomyces clavuligerus]WDN56464.1 hypothetical protein LL058_32000 [Streptomyces clavuligerus]